jgi:hypothetical protein
MVVMILSGRGGRRRERQGCGKDQSSFHIRLFIKVGRAGDRGASWWAKPAEPVLNSYAKRQTGNGFLGPTWLVDPATSSPGPMLDSRFRSAFIDRDRIIFPRPS